MAGETILVIDAGEDIDQRMTTTLEAEGYLIYPVSSQDVNAEMAALLRPSLIYIRPPDLRPTGLEPCKAIHGIPLLMKVPVIILASLRKAPGSQYFDEYGIVDFLELTFTTEELIEKTETVLGKTPLFQLPKEDKPITPPQTLRNTEKKRPTLFRQAIGAILLVGIAGTGFLAYQQFMPSQKVLPSLPIKAPIRVPSVAPKADLKPQLPPANKVADTPIPASSVPSTPPVQPSSVSSENASQPPRKPFYSVQLGAFRNEEMAQALTKKFQEKGYDAFTQPGVTKDRFPIYRVLVNKYEDRKAAQKMAGEIQTREQIKTAIYSE
jgi:cell division protein FtsN